MRKLYDHFYEYYRSSNLTNSEQILITNIYLHFHKKPNISLSHPKMLNGL